MSVSGKKLGLLLAAHPSEPNFTRGLTLAETAIAQGVDVYLYCIDQAVAGLENERVQKLRGRGVKLFACAFGAQRRGQPVSDAAIFSGLSVVHDLIASTDRFVCFT